METIREQAIDLLKGMGWRFSVNEDGCIFLGTKSDFTWAILYLWADEDNRRLVNVAYLLYSEPIPCKRCGGIRTLPVSGLSIFSAYRQIWEVMKAE